MYVWKRAQLPCWPSRCARSKQGSTQARDLPWFWNSRQTSPEVRNKGISGPTKRNDVLKKVQKKKKVGNSGNHLRCHKTVIMWNSVDKKGAFEWKTLSNRCPAPIWMRNGRDISQENISTWKTVKSCLCHKHWWRIKYKLDVFIWAYWHNIISRVNVIFSSTWTAQHTGHQYTTWTVQL